MKFRIIVGSLLGLLLMTSAQVWAHGEPVRGVGGVGIETMGGEVTGVSSIAFHYDQRRYRLFSEQQLLNFKRFQGEDVHEHAKEELYAVSITVGLSELWDLSLQIGYGRFSGFLDNSDAFAIANNTISKTGVSSGLSDLLAMARYQFYKNEDLDQHLAVVMGVKLPTGNYRSEVNNGVGNKRPEMVGTHNQIGSGSLDTLLGVAYTGHFMDRIGVSADLLTRINTEGAKSFRSGNAIQADIAIAYNPHAWIVPSLELNYIGQALDIENDEKKKNSAVTSLFFTPGITVKVMGNQSLFANYSTPVIQNLPGIQNKESNRFSGGYAVSF